MNFNLFGFNLEANFNHSYFYEVLVFPCDLNGEIDEDRAYVFGGYSRLQAYYQGWRNARMQAKAFCMDFRVFFTRTITSSPNWYIFPVALPTKAYYCSSKL